MEDTSMDDAFDFSGLSLDEPEDRLQKAFEKSLQIDSGSSVGHQPPLQQVDSFIEHQLAGAVLNEGQNTIPLKENATGPSTDTPTPETPTPDNGAWATIPSPGERNPFMPGVTAEMLDAMALDPNHVFKSATGALPFTIPPELKQQMDELEQASRDPNLSKPNNAFTDATFPDTSDEIGKQSTIATEIAQMQSDTADAIPAWMLADDMLSKAQATWSSNDTAGPSFNAQDFALDWGAPSNRATVMDSNALFGFTSFPSYENLGISNLVTSDQLRRNNTIGFSDPDEADWGSNDQDNLELTNSDFPISGTHFLNSDNPFLNEDGFAKYIDGGGSSFLVSPTLPNSESAGGVSFNGLSDLGVSTTPQQMVNSSSGFLFDSKGAQFQGWRNTQTNGYDLDLELDLGEGPSGSEIKATPGFAPANFQPEAN